MIRVFSYIVAMAVFSGSFLTLVQSQKVLPLILQAEQFEGGPVIAYSNTKYGKAHDHEHAVIDAHDHPPSTTIESRLVKTWVMNAVICASWVLIIMTMLLLHRRYRWYDGILMGLIGFYSLFAAPALGLHPELPGSVAASLEARQVWWVLAAGSSLVGLNILISKAGPLIRIGGLGIAAVPYFFQAPSPEMAGGTAPLVLAKQFITATWWTNLSCWVFTGLMVGWFGGKLLKMVTQSRAAV